MNHKLKIQQEYLDNLVAGVKKVEIRINDRDYQSGDTLEFNDYSVHSKPKLYTFKITHIHSGDGMNQNVVALSVELSK